MSEHAEPILESPGILQDGLALLADFGVSAGEIVLIVLLLLLWMALAARNATMVRAQRMLTQNMKKFAEYVRDLDVKLRRIFQEGASPVTETHIERLRHDIQKLAASRDDDGGGENVDEVLQPILQRIDAHLEQGAQRLENAVVQAGEERTNRIESRIEGVSELVKSEKREGGASSDSVGELRDKIEQQAMYLHDEFAAIVARIDRLAESGIGGAAQHAETASAASGGDKAMMESLKQSIHRLGEEIDAKLSLLNGKLERNMEAKWSDALGSVSSLRERIEELAADGGRTDVRDVATLSQMMGAHDSADDEDGRRLLSEILSQILSPGRFTLDAALPGGKIADALVRFPDPRDSIAIDAGFSPAAESNDKDESRRKFAAALSDRIGYVADNLIAPPHTGENALLFAPSDAIFAEIHAHHREAVKEAQSRGVWLTSPSTLPAVVNTVNAAVRDHHARRKMLELREMAAQIAEEARLFENRLTEIGDHVNSAWRSVQRAESAGGRLLGGIRDISRVSRETENAPPSVAANDDSRRA